MTLLTMILAMTLMVVVIVVARVAVVVVVVVSAAVAVVGSVVDVACIRHGIVPGVAPIGVLIHLVEYCHGMSWHVMSCHVIVHGE